MEKANETTQIKVRLAPLPDSNELAAEIKDFMIEINGKKCHISDYRVRKISRTAAQVFPACSSLILNLPEVDGKFIELFYLAITNAQEIRIEVSQLRMLAELWNRFEINGSLTHNDITVIATLEETLLDRVDGSTWFEFIEFASALDLMRLYQKCLEILEAQKFCYLKTPRGKLHIKDKYFEELLEYHHKKRLEKSEVNNMTKDSADFLNPSELQSLIVTQFEYDTTSNSRMLWKDHLLDKYATGEGKDGDLIRISRLEIRNKDLRKELGHISEHITTEKIKQDEKIAKLLHGYEELNGKVKELEKKLARGGILNSMKVFKTSFWILILVILASCWGYYMPTKEIQQHHTLMSPKQEYFVYRFELDLKTHVYNQYGYINLTFTASQDIYILGFGVYDDNYNSGQLSLRVQENGRFIESVTYSSQITTIFSQVTKLDFDKPFRCKKNHIYTFYSLRNADGRSYYQMKPMKYGYGNDGTTLFTFYPAQRGLSMESDPIEQFPVIFYRRAFD